MKYKYTSMTTKKLTWHEQMLKEIEEETLFELTGEVYK